MRFVTFDPMTGEIIGRHLVTSQRHMDSYEDWIEIDARTYDSFPEIFDAVNLSTKTLIDAPFATIKARHPDRNRLSDAELRTLIDARKSRIRGIE